MSDEVIEGLKSARILLENGWTAGKAARNRRGESVGVFDPTACSFCVLGAVWRVGGFVDPLGGCMEDLVRRVIRARVPLGDHAPGKYNDAEGRTKEEILSVIDEAIELAKAEGCLMEEAIRDAKE